MLVLIVEDDHGLVELVEQALTDNQYNTKHASTIEEAIQSITENKPDIMILDYILKNQKSSEILKQLQQNNIDIPPFVVTTGFGDERVAVEMMKMGARDYLIKDINFLEMLPRVINRVKNEIENETKRRETEEKLKNQQAILDNTQKLTKIGGWEYDVLKNKMTWTKETFRIHGFDLEKDATNEEELINKSLQCYTNGYRDKVKQAFEECIRWGKSYDIEGRFKKITGEEIWIRSTAKAEKENGKIVRVTGNIMDITDVKSIQERLKYRNNLGEAIKKISATLIKHKKTNYDEILKILGTTVRVNRAYIFKFRQDKKIVDNINEWCSKNTEPQIENLQNLETKVCRWTVDKLAKNEKIIINNINDLPDKAKEEKKTFTEQKIKSLVIIPIFINEQTLWGFMGFDDTDSFRQWNEFEIEVLTIVSEMLSGDIEREKFHKKLEISRKSYQDIFNSVGEAIYIQDKEGAFIDVNKGAEEMYGMSREELIGLNPEKVAAEGYNNLAEIKKLSERTFRTGETSQFEFWAKKKTGEIFPKDVICNKGKYFGKDVLITTARDISARKKMEEELKNSEDKYRRLIENTGEGITIVDDEETILFANPAAEEMFGIEQETLVGRNLKEFMDDENADFIRSETQRRKDGDGSDYHVTIIRPDKSERLIHVTATPYFDDNKKFIGSYGIMRDNTERWLAEEKLRTSEQQFRTLVSNIPGIAYRCKNDENWTMVYFSEEALQITGYDNTDFINNNRIAYNDIIHPDDREHVRIRVQKAIESRQTYTMEYRIIHKDGSIHWVYEKGQGIFDEGKLVYLDGVIIDIDDRKRIEKERQQLEVRLRRSQKMETIGTLAGGVAHDFNNILTPIMGYADMALTKLPKSNPVYEEIEYILSASQRARELVRQILTFSRQLDTEKRPVKLQKIVSEAVKLLRPTLPATISMDLTVDDDGYIMADPAQLHQVIMNLCTNSFHAMEETGGTLKINLSRASITPEISRNYPKLSQGQYLNLMIQDSGTGIDTKTMERIFEPFFTTKPVDKGTGMGLSVVHGIIQNHNGEIVVSSKIGQGATFQIFLPVEKNPPAEEKETKKETIPGNESIVIVDDETSITKMTNKILSHLGYRVTSFNSSRKILDHLLENHQNYDLLLSDLTMPEMTGIDLAGELRRRNIKIPIVIMTGYGDHLSDTVRYNYGIETVISKPIIIHEIAEKLREILD